MKQETLHIKGMSCGHCVAAVREALESIEGVSVEAVEIGTAEVRYDETTTNRDRLVEVVEEAGYMVPSEV